MKKLIAVLLLAMSTPCVADTYGWDSGTAAVQTVTPNSSSHSSGQSIGGLFTIPIARSPGGSGEVENVTWTSSGGSTAGIQVKLWDRKPTGTTCTDQTNYAGSAADDAHLIVAPQQASPLAPTSTQGDAKTYASLKFTPPLSFKNQDAVATQNIYACVIATATDTADENTAVYLIVSGPQN